MALPLRTYGGIAGRVPGPQGPHPSRLLPLPSVAPHRGCARRPAGPSSLGFSGRPFAPLRVLPGRGPCPCPRPLRARRARFARLAALSPRSPARPLVRRCAAPRALAGPVCLRPRPRCAAGSLFGRPCCAWPWALCSAWPRGGSLAPPPGQGSRSAPPRPPCGPCGPLFPLRGAGAWLAARGRLRPLAAPLRGRCGNRGVLPCRPPPGRPRWGLPGARGSPWRGACGPPPGVCFSQPFPGGPPGDGRAPRGFFPRLTMRKLSNGGFPKIRGRGFARRRASHFTARVKAKPPAF